MEAIGVVPGRPAGTRRKVVGTRSSWTRTAMDLHLAGRKAIVCASSQGLGRACATSLSREGVQVFINGRTEAKLAATAAEIQRETGHPVVPVVADIMTEDGRARLVAACPDADILVNNNAGPTPGKFEDWAREDYL